ncbi:restriction endonuclease subunit S [Acinetobacter sp. SM34]|uniref:restriction endonuclease subunit S n=1 Tax=Acinetobacter sp. SM34 TaxID=1301620 RepID=UPI001EDABCC7|nr:restriction endonuclease subunit S [Acinetobacter sp. SM34]MCG2609058.1 restriction endonuclease subunit S [Acinetobacter sp. SM34]
MFNRYDAYKDSGIDWVGKIPAHWNVLKLGSIFEQRNQKVSDQDYPALSVTKNGIVPQLDNAAKTKDGDNRKLVLKGDFVINSRSDRKGSSGLSSLDGSVSLINIVLKPKKIEPKFSHHLMKCNAFIEEYYRVGRGIVADLWTTRFEEMKTMNLALPSVEEQRQIADFIDQRLVEIDQAIAIKEQQITLLNERKQIVIQKVVTQGLNPNLPMKDSGVEWIGQIPEHWKCVKLKYFIDLIPGYAFKSEEYSSNDKDIKLLRGINVSPNQIKWSETVYWPSEKVDMYEEYLLQEGDIVIAMDRPWVSGGIRIAEIGKHDLPALLLQRVARMRSKVGISNKYLKLLLTNDLFLAYFTPMLTGISVPHISGNQIENFICPLPNIDEQNQIIQYLEQNLSEIKKAKELLLTQIEKLKEYKTTLINDAVTGKFKVA